MEHLIEIVFEEIEHPKTLSELIGSISKMAKSSASNATSKAIKEALLKELKPLEERILAENGHIKIYASLDFPEKSALSCTGFSESLLSDMRAVISMPIKS